MCVDISRFYLTKIHFKPTLKTIRIYQNTSRKSLIGILELQAVDIIVRLEELLEI